MSSSAASADLLFRPVDELAALVRTGELSARELVQASLDRIEALDPQLNAFVDVFAEEALEAADAIPAGDARPLAGVPIAIKNNTAVAGKRLTFASDFMGDFVAPFDAALVERLRDAAGAIVVGTTTLPEFGILPTTETRRFGPTRNPWDTGRTPGGSSGGSGAAVAAGMVPIAHANDGGGSTRIPAACCGLVGLKPQRGRISMAPAVGEQFLGVEGVLTRTTRESALVLDLLAGPSLGDASWAADMPETCLEALGRERHGLRIGLMLTPPLPDVEPAPECAGAARAAAELLEEMGHHVEEVEPPFRARELLQTFTAVFGPMVCSQALVGTLVHGREPTIEDVERLTLWLWETCRDIDAITAYGALVQVQAAGRQLVAWSAPYDAIVTPALAEPPLPLGTLDPDAEDPAGTFARSGEFTPYTAALNISGQPGLSLPLFHDEERNLPLGVQLVGRPNEEGLLLALAAQLEAAQPWAQRRAPVS
jgi:amidase